MEKIIKGGDLLLSVDGKCIGHCTSHTVTITSEIKTRAYKKPQSTAQGAGMFKNKSVTGVDVNIKFDGLVTLNEAELGYEALQAIILAGESVEVKSFMRKTATDTGTPTPLLSGNFVLSSLENSAPEGDDATYSGELQNDGAVTASTNVLSPDVSV